MLVSVTCYSSVLQACHPIREHKILCVMSPIPETDSNLSKWTFADNPQHKNVCCFFFFFSLKCLRTLTNNNYIQESLRVAFKPTRSKHVFLTQWARFHIPSVMCACLCTALTMQFFYLSVQSIKISAFYFIFCFSDTIGSGVTFICVHQVLFEPTSGTEAGPV